jgi:uncharacterized cysteine cluster protein YcgN (CxxCxxCC family)
MSDLTFLSKPLEDFTDQEWESLCDGCGLCCQVRVEDEDTGEMAVSNVACTYLCLDSHQCKDYLNRHKNVPDCIKVTPENVLSLTWLPSSCAYRLVAYGQDLPPWHYLICGDKEQVHRFGPSMKGSLISEEDADWEI